LDDGGSGQTPASQRQVCPTDSSVISITDLGARPKGTPEAYAPAAGVPTWCEWTSMGARIKMTQITEITHEKKFNSPDVLALWLKRRRNDLSGSMTLKNAALA
jgi:hypothetical protein